MMRREPVSDFDGDGHAEAEIDQAVVNLHLCLVERYPRGIDQLLSVGLAAVAFVARAFPVSRPVLRLLANDGILVTLLHLTMN